MNSPLRYKLGNEVHAQLIKIFITFYIKKSNENVSKYRNNKRLVIQNLCVLWIIMVSRGSILGWGTMLVEAKGHDFDFRWGRCIFQSIYTFQHYGTGIDPVSNRNEYQESSSGEGRGGKAVPDKHIAIC
jgi:hypothetical protein